MDKFYTHYYENRTRLLGHTVLWKLDKTPWTFAIQLYKNENDDTGKIIQVDGLCRIMQKV